MDTLVITALVSLTTVIVSLLVGVAWAVGYHRGYWTRVGEEKMARGIP